MSSDPAEPTVDALPVELVHWPRDQHRREALARAGVPRLVLVDHDVSPPADIGIDEDWIHVPADERDLLARIHRVMEMAERTAHRPVAVTEDGVLRVGDRTVVLSVSESRLVRALLENAGRVVRRDALARSLWSGEPPSPKALDALVYRTRRRLAVVGLLIHTSHGRGFVIEAGHDDFGSP